MIRRLYFFLVFFLTGLFFANCQVLTPSYYELCFNSDTKEINRLIKSGDSWALYKLAPYLDSQNQMYLATRDHSHILAALKLIIGTIDQTNNSSNLPKSQFKDNYRGWMNMSHTDKGNDGKEYPLFESYFWRYATYTLYLIKRDHLNMFSDSFDKILLFSEKHIYEKWKQRGQHNIYRENTNMASHWAAIGLNLWRVTGEREYLDIAKKFILNFNNNIKYNKDGSIFWNSFYDTKKWDKRGQDVLHANAEVGFFIEAYRDGLINKVFINRIIKTLETIVLRKDLSTAMYLDGSGESKGRIVDGFMKLGRLDPNLQMKLRKLRYYQPSEYHRECQFVAVLLANEALLKNNHI